ncbi:MAG: TIGR04211 family SH3 domain-containing protein [Desulfobulbaceae bacterium]|nr:TIGR04211 family SH3 domain-containing protein [Desulfobulbaceae bacterium]
MLTPRRLKISDRLPHLFSPLTFVILPIALFFCWSAVQAETLYVKPSSEIPIRSGQGTEFKILSVVPDGLMVELVEESDPWAKVRTPGGTEGWMLRRYLSSEPPLSEMVDILKAEKSELETKEEAVSQKFDELSLAYTQMQQEYNACLAERDELRNNYQMLQQDTADVIRIKENLTRTTQEIEEIREKLAAAERKNRNLRNSITVKWFLAGGGVLVIGWLIGLMSARSRKKKSSLY